MAYQEHAGINAIDDLSAAIDAIREAMGIVGARHRDCFCAEDEEEYDRIHDALDRLFAYHAIIRAEMSKQRITAQGRRA